MEFGKDSKGLGIVCWDIATMSDTSRFELSLSNFSRLIRRSGTDTTSLFDNRQAGVVGYYLSSNDMSVEDEVQSLKSVMAEMKATLSEARGRTRKPSGDSVKEIGSA